MGLLPNNPIVSYHKSKICLICLAYSALTIHSRPLLYPVTTWLSLAVCPGSIILNDKLAKNHSVPVAHLIMWQLCGKIPGEIFSLCYYFGLTAL